jgi:hypothetical protein
LKIEECGFSLQDQNIRIHWYIDYGFSKHMSGEKNKFVTLKRENEGSVMFGNDNASKIIGKGIFSLGNKDVVEENVILVENMKHSFLSVK